VIKIRETVNPSLINVENKYSRLILPYGPSWAWIIWRPFTILLPHKPKDSTSEQRCTGKFLCLKPLSHFAPTARHDGIRHLSELILYILTLYSGLIAKKTCKTLFFAEISESMGITINWVCLWFPLKWKPKQFQQKVRSFHHVLHEQYIILIKLQRFM